MGGKTGDNVTFVNERTRFYAFNKFDGTKPNKNKRNFGFLNVRNLCVGRWM